MKIFLDTSGLVAYYNKDDIFHDDAVEVMRNIRKGDIPLTRFYITDYIFDEAMTFIECVLERHELALAVGDALLTSLFTSWIRVDEELFQDTWRRFQVVHDVSFTDCASFAVMERHGITHAFTFDSHFKESGYKTIPD